jgi:hypothetical protein
VPSADGGRYTALAGAGNAKSEISIKDYCMRNCTMTVKCEAVGFPSSMAGS